MKKPRILIIDDDHDTRVGLRFALQNEGYVVWSAGNGLQALRMLDRINRPRIILLDMMMPVMDGMEFLKRKQADPSLASIHVVAMSAFPEAQRFIASRVEGFLTKPLDMNRLMDLLEKLCKDCSPEELAEEEETNQDVQLG